MATKMMSAFTEEEMAAMASNKTRKPSAATPVHHENAPKTENTKMLKNTGTGPDGIHAVRGMSLKINEMLAMGCFTADDIIKCITPMTRDYSEKQAVTKLASHLKNMQKHGATIIATEDACLSCKDVVLPELQD